MKLLLDTCAFLWIVSEDARLSESARAAFRDPANDVLLSAVSAWEIMVKHALGRLPLPDPARDFVTCQRQAHRITTLPLEETAAALLPSLPMLHRDPFDRMLICQALDSGAVLLTPDAHIRQYPARTLW